MASPYLKTTASGSTSWATAGNWQGGVPAATDTPSIFQGTADLDSGLDQHTVTLGAGGLTVTSGFTGTAGEATVEGASLQIASPLFRFLRQFNGGSFVDGGTTRFRLNPGTGTATDVFVEATGSPADEGLGAVQLTGGGTTTGTVSVSGGFVSLAGRPGETFTLNAAKVTGGTLIVGAGVTFGGTAPALTQDDGTVVLSAALATLVQTGGTLYSNGTGAVTTATVRGECHFNHRPGGAAFATLTIEEGGVAIFDEDPRGLTVTNTILMHRGSRLRVFGGTQINVGGSGGLRYQTVGCDAGDVTIEGAVDAVHLLS